MKDGVKPEYPEKTPGDELQKMPHTKARRFNSLQSVTLTVKWLGEHFALYNSSLFLGSMLGLAGPVSEHCDRVRASFIYNFYLSVAAHALAYADASL